MTFERPTGDYALMHANGMSWAEVLRKHRMHVLADAHRRAAKKKAANGE